MAKPRVTNVLRLYYRLGWILIWGMWLLILIMFVPSPDVDAWAWGFYTVLTTTLAWVLHRLWDRITIGRPLPRRQWRYLTALVFSQVFCGTKCSQVWVQRCKVLLIDEPLEVNEKVSQYTHDVRYENSCSMKWNIQEDELLLCDYFLACLLKKDIECVLPTRTVLIWADLITLE